MLQALDGTPEASVPAEIRITGDHEFYDFEAKYLPEEATELDVPAVLPDGVADRMRSLAGAGVRRPSAARAWPGSTSSCSPTATLVVNEINTMPGFTPLSMYPRMWAASGLDYPALVDRLIRLALAARHRPALTRSPSTEPPSGRSAQAARLAGPRAGRSGRGR